MSTAKLKTKLVLGPELAGTSMSPEEFDAVDECDELFVYELIHGVLVVSPPPLEAERDPNEELGFLLRLHKRDKKRSRLDATLSEQYVRTPDSRRRADRVIWAGLGRQPDPRRDKPTIVVEFVSAGKRSRLRDYVEKRQEYMELGVSEYWLIDRFRRTLTVYKTDERELVIQENQSYRTPLLPGFELPLANLLAVADRWKDR